jgi:hypothetical protein
MGNAIDRIVKELESKHPGWQIWAVYRVVGGTLYCARRWDGTGHSLSGNTPQELSEYIAEAEAD